MRAGILSAEPLPPHATQQARDSSGGEPASPALIAAADAALAASSQRVLMLEHGGASYVLKRMAHRPRSWGQALLLRWLVKQVSGQALPMHTLRLSQASSSVDFEGRRLLSLARAGMQVPRVFHQGAGYLLLEHCGSSVALLLQHWTAEVWRVELARLAAQLGDFHKAGQWHGAAQIKNLTRRGQLDYRIDFEEDFGELVPLAAAQALDLALFLNSISLRASVDAAEARRLLPELIRAYFASNPDAAIAQLLARALPWATALARFAARLMGLPLLRHRGKGVARLLILVEALAAQPGPGSPAVAPPAPPAQPGSTP